MIFGLGWNGEAKHQNEVFQYGSASKKLSCPVGFGCHLNLTSKSLVMIFNRGPRLQNVDETLAFPAISTHKGVLPI